MGKYWWISKIQNHGVSFRPNDGKWWKTTLIFPCFLWFWKTRIYRWIETFPWNGFPLKFSMFYGVYLVHEETLGIFTETETKWRLGCDFVLYVVYKTLVKRQRGSEVCVYAGGLQQFYCLGNLSQLYSHAKFQVKGCLDVQVYKKVFC